MPYSLPTIFHFCPGPLTIGIPGRYGKGAGGQKRGNGRFIYFLAPSDESEQALSTCSVSESNSQGFRGLAPGKGKLK